MPSHLGRRAKSIALPYARPDQAWVRGNAMVEWLVAVPVLLLVGLAVLQLALVLQMRGVLEHAAQQAVRRAAVLHGHGQALEEGLLEGLRPVWQHATTGQGQARLAQALAAGWLSWERLFPDGAVIADFSIEALDEWGRPLAGEREIPNDNLRFRPDRVGARSGLTLTEANRIELELRYGVPLVVPLVGGFFVRVMEIVHGCRPSESLRLGLTALGEVTSLGNGRYWGCAMYRLPDDIGGVFRWRWPMHLRAGASMQSPFRMSAANRSAAGPAAAQPPARQGFAATPNLEPLSEGLEEKDPAIGDAPDAAQSSAPSSSLSGRLPRAPSVSGQLLGLDAAEQPGRCE